MGTAGWKEASLFNRELKVLLVEMESELGVQDLEKETGDDGEESDGAVC